MIVLIRRRGSVYYSVVVQRYCVMPDNRDADDRYYNPHGYQLMAGDRLLVRLDGASCWATVRVSGDGSIYPPPRDYWWLDARGRHYEMIDGLRVSSIAMR